MRRAVVILFLMPALALAQVALRPQEEVDYVYKVVSGGCPRGASGGVRVQLSQTGFRVRGVAGIVTALHGVVGCTTITAHGAGRFRSFVDLKLGGVDLAKDVALLTGADLDASQGLLPVPSQQALQELARPNAPLTVVGYPDGVKGQTTTHLLARPVRPLRDQVPGEAIRQLATRGSPSPDTTVLFIEGHLLPGHSGAPVLDSEDRVVAVGNGGLAEGKVEIGWAIPWPSIEWSNPASLVSELDRISRLGAAVLQSKVPEEQISLVVGLCPEPTDRCDPDPSVLARPPFVSQTDLRYRLQRSSDGLTVFPSMKYLDAFQAGGTIREMVREHVSFNEPPPILDVRLTNNSDRTVFFSAARFEVQRSLVDPSPLLVFGWDPKVLRAGIAELYNEGWGTARSVELQFNLRPPREDDGFESRNFAGLQDFRRSGGPVAEPEAAASPVTGGPFRHRVVLGDVKRFAGVDFTSALLREGVRVRRMLRYGDEKVRSKAQPSAVIPPAYRIGWAIAEGQLRFTATSPDGQSAPRSVAFSIGVPLVDYVGSGAGEPPSGHYAVELQSDGVDYEREVSISQYLKPGEVDRFTVRIWVPQSSIHAFRLRLVYEDGQSILSPPISMSYFRSVSGAAAMEMARKFPRVMR